MPRYRTPTASTKKRTVARWRTPTASTKKRIRHRYRTTLTGEPIEVFRGPDLPTITSFTITPANETQEQRTARGASPMFTAAWLVTAEEEAMAGRTYMYGTKLTAGQTSATHRTGWSIQHSMGSVSVASTVGRVSFITYFASTPTTTVQNDLNMRYFLRNDFNQLTSQTQATPRAIEVNGTRYLLVARNSLPGFSGAGFVSDQGVPPFVNGGVYNVQVWVGGTADDPSTWQAAFPNTLSQTVAAMAAVYPTLTLTFTPSGGTRTTYTATTDATGGGSAMIPTPASDGAATLKATNSEGDSVTARDRYDYRTAISGLSVVEVENATTRAGTNNQQSYIGIRARWQADPCSAARLEVGNYNQLNLSDLLHNTPYPSDTRSWDTTRYFVIPRGSVQQSIRFTLYATGVSAQNVAGTERSSFIDITVPARVGG